MTSKDPLFALYKLCQGEVRLVINDHRVSYRSVEVELNDGHKNIPPKIREEMIQANTFVWVDFRPQRGKEEFRSYGHNIYSACYEAILKAVKVLGEFPEFEYPAENVTALLQELADVCKASVIFDINEFKGESQDATAAQYFKEEERWDEERFKPDKDGDYEISPEERKAMEEKDEVIKAHFYPNTPVGSYSLYDLDIVKVLQQAVALAKRSVGEFP